VKKVITTFIEWDFNPLSDDHVLGTFRYTSGPQTSTTLHLHVTGFRMCNVGIVRDRRCLQVNMWIHSDHLRYATNELFGESLIGSAGEEIAGDDNVSEEITGYGFMSVDWALQKGESTVDGAIRIAQALKKKLNFRTHKDRWDDKRLISWFSVLQHTTVFTDDDKCLSEEDYLRRKHNLPEINSTFSPMLVRRHMEARTTQPQ
jgi:hypothetical protein